MKRLIQCAVRLYPRRWRNRYGAEFSALLDEVEPRWRIFADVARGGIDMHVRALTPAALTVLLALGGAVLAGVGALAMPARFESRSRIAVLGTDDRTTVMDALQAALGGAVESLSAADSMSRADMAVTVTSTPHEFQVAYGDSEPRRAQERARRLMSGTIDAHLRSSTALQLKIITPPDLPASASRPFLISMIGLGFAGGGGLGALLGILRRRRAA